MNGSDANGGTADNAAAETGGTAPELGKPVIEPAVEEAVTSTATAARARIEGVDRLSQRDQLASILVAVGPGPHSGATVDLAQTVAKTTDAWLDLFHVVPDDDTADPEGGESEDPSGPDAAGDAAGNTDSDAAATTDATTGDRLLSIARERIAGFERADQWLVEDGTAAGAIVEQSPYYDLVVVGASTTGTVGQFVFGSTTETVVDEAAVPVVVVESNDPTPIISD